MKRIILAAAALAALCATPAAAQFGPYDGGGYYQDDDDDRPRRYRRGYDDGYGRPYGPPPRYRQPRVAYGNVCVTSRGSCAVRPRPHNSPCGCSIPGFGYKRGAVMGGSRAY
jgi:hypothetical protein